MSNLALKADNAFLYKRVENILHHLESDNVLDINVNDASTLTDQQLLEQLLSIHTRSTYKNDKLIKRLEMQREGQKKFISFLGTYGGTVTQTKYAELAGVSRQHISGKIKKGSLIAINEGSTPRIPVFQLDDKTGAEIFGLDTVNLALQAQQVGPSMMCTFWLNQHGGLDNLSPRNFLQKNPNKEAVQQVIKYASRVGQPGY
ncbi:hypothetical protein [Thalassomonas sp. RHCl1]|uniref:hypothetical protein n=1 Tax=Thalassomonas sp. RHCl1 TaxID=2995320 RepID=UPI00248BE30B|nr:hypothetical protein [Thalassomonas sp. RHCl1]